MKSFITHSIEIDAFPFLSNTESITVGEDGSSSFRVEHNTHNAPLVVEPGGHVCRPLAGLCTCPRGVFEQE
ncbi:hypothetical protein KTE91_33825, partial [Burkholderia multivorans]|uniref:hypothetical protein n=1 Tax=Burkholderia multivorans TaxID=87883 RepID=UPI001C2310A6